MVTTRVLLAGTLFTFMTMLASPVRAAYTGDSARPTPEAHHSTPPVSGWRLMGSTGVFENDYSGGFSLGATLQYRYDLLAVGAKFELGSALFSDHVYGLAWLSGISMRPHHNVRVQLLGEFGAHDYSAVGSGLLSDDPGARGSTAYAGGRAELSFPVGHRSNHFEFGLYADFQDDLSRQKVTYTYPTRSGWFGGGEYDGGHAQATHTVGMARAGVGIALGGTHDIW